MSDGIEVHFDEKRGYLQLGCEPDAFAPYRELARSQLADMPEISLDKISEIYIVDSAKSASGRNGPRWGLQDIAIAAVLFAIFGLAGVGLVSLVLWSVSI
jgi:hypothetical protein